MTKGTDFKKQDPEQVELIEGSLSYSLTDKAEAEAELIITGIQKELDNVRAGQTKTIDDFLKAINTIVPTATDAPQPEYEEKYDDYNGRKTETSTAKPISLSSADYINNAKVQNRNISENDPELSEAPKKKFILRFLPSFIFYFVLACAVVVALANAGGRAEDPRNIFGYSYFNVLSTSMQDEIPKGSLVITKNTDPDDLEIGDNITFFRNADKTITHKIMGIYENCGPDSDQRGFQTQGVNNSRPDSEIVLSQSIIGKVVYSFPNAGNILDTVKKNMAVIIVSLILLLALSFALQTFFGIRKEEKAKKTRLEKI